MASCTNQIWGMRAAYIGTILLGIGVLITEIIMVSDAAATEKLNHAWGVGSSLACIFLGVYAWIANLYGEPKVIQDYSDSSSTGRQCAIEYTAPFWHWLIVIAGMGAIIGITYGIFKATV